MDDNPYAAFPASRAMPAGPIDREARDRLAADLRDYLNDQITAFQLDERIFDAPLSEDPVVRFVSNEAWLFYDDCKDHQVVIDRRGWKYLQRLLLLLESDCSVALERRRLWSLTQLVAVVALACFAGAVWQIGWNHLLWLVTISLGLISMLIGWLRTRGRQRLMAAVGPYQEALAPFGSFAELRTICDATPHFSRASFSPELAQRRIRPDSSNTIMRLQRALSQLLYSPAYLLAQCFPMDDTTPRVIVPRRSVH
ncbi:hypothetical protein Pla108_06550 [Botrimarina colliarenosi]|uniref:Uncharacterized protein n=1 Tax=Botrimarina colliarenosi TaxID=2528001 RepID=A0A5C6AI43_9BACT|nr:hypothetical protein [Botrimarina colliarenosi]TWT99712.1 hypothetical protein Pla108_06550 [Botrimarina colliarenosi]